MLLRLPLSFLFTAGLVWAAPQDAATLKNLLQGALAEQREATGDFGLDDTLNWAEVRVAVEAAKLERANEPAVR